MGVQINHEGALGQELAKWEQHHTKYVGDDQNPGNPYVYRPYPKMLYKAQRHPVSGKTSVCEPPPNMVLFTDANAYQRAELAVDTFNRSCQRIVQSEDEHRIAMNDGWRESPTAALEEYTRRSHAHAELAASRHYSDQFMGDAARREADAADADTDAQLAEIPETPKRRGRKDGAPMVTVD